VNALNDGETLQDSITYTMTDADGDKSTATLTITINGRTDGNPSVKAETVIVSEEGLVGGLPDDKGGNDTTNETTAMGQIVLTAAQNISLSDLSIQLTGPEGITVQGKDVIWNWDSDTDTLTGQVVLNVGEPAIDVMTIKVDNIKADGSDYVASYETTLLHAIDHSQKNIEDELDLTFELQVNNGIEILSNGDLVVTVEDDSPVIDSGDLSIGIEPAAFNLSVILDISGSMRALADYTKSNTETRLDVAKKAVDKLIDSYSGMGNVMVQITLFDGDASTQDVWMTAADAKTFISTIESNGGSTNYDAALGLALQGFDKPGKIEGAENYSYFLTDGEPAYGQGGVNSLSPGYSGDEDTGIQPGEEKIWTDFLIANKIKSYAFAIGDVDSVDSISPISFDGQKGKDNDAELAVVVTDLNQLDAIFSESALANGPQGTMNLIKGGNTEGVTAGYGADGGHVLSFTVDGSTYIYSRTTGDMTIEGDSRGSYNQETTTVTIGTLAGGTIALNFESGDYTYYTNPNFDGTAYTEEISFSVEDNDGDTVYAEQTVSISSNSNDTIEFSADNALIDGGDGFDTLLINTVETIDFISFDSSKIDNMELIELGNGVQSLTNLSTSDVINMTDSHNTLFINGDNADQVSLTSDFEKQQTSNETGYAQYQSMLDPSVILYVDTDITPVI
ncbi:MAG: vWA domain-containing protein, partial [Oceanisphaera sp.]|uniref:vWA domain-containing protein n=1 Tax=Oceanisphaera sp. TaxID=1929979 RepID=UPI003C71663B